MKIRQIATWLLQALTNQVSIHLLYVGTYYMKKQEIFQAHTAKIFQFQIQRGIVILKNMREEKRDVWQKFKFQNHRFHV